MKSYNKVILLGTCESGSFFFKDLVRLHPNVEAYDNIMFKKYWCQEFRDFATIPIPEDHVRAGVAVYGRIYDVLVNSQYDLSEWKFIFFDRFMNDSISTHILSNDYKRFRGKEVGRNKAKQKYLKDYSDRFLDWTIDINDELYLFNSKTKHLPNCLYVDFQDLMKKTNNTIKRIYTFLELDAPKNKDIQDVFDTHEVIVRAKNFPAAPNKLIDSVSNDLKQRIRDKITNKNIPGKKKVT